MCYSAQIWADYHKFSRVFGAIADIKTFMRVFQQRAEGAPIRIPKTMEAAFADPQTEAESEIEALIVAYNEDLVIETERQLFQQTQRLADAERRLRSKRTQTAAASKRIALDKIEKAKRKLADLRRVDLEPRDSRIYPGSYAPVMVMEDGRHVVKAMRYRCRPADKPALYDTRFPGTYNARRDNLEGFWKNLFGYSHGIMVVNAFYENVRRHRVEGRDLAEGETDANVVLEFRPEPARDILVACLWSRWQAPGQPELLSFAAITDEPPAEVAAAGHDRCIIPIKPEQVDAWLHPDPRNLAAQYAILDDRERPYYAYRQAA